MADEFRFLLTDLHGRIPATKDGASNFLAEVEFIGNIELVLKYVDSIEVPVPGLEGIAWYHVPQPMKMTIELGEGAQYVMRKPELPSAETLRAANRALELYPIEDGSYPGVDRNAEARAAYLRGREEHGR